MVLFFVVSIILLIVLLLTYSRSALLAFALPVFFMGIFYFRSILIIGSLALILVLPFAPRALDRITDGLQSAVSVTQEETMFLPDPTARLRVENFSQGTTLALDNFWTGIGFNTIRLYKTENIHSAGGFDSSLLTVLVTSGIFGLTAFLFFYYQAVKNLIRQAWKSNDMLKKGASIGAAFGFIGIFAQSFFINSLFFPFFMVFVFGILGILLADE